MTGIRSSQQARAHVDSILTGTLKDGMLTLEGTSHTKTTDIPHRITWKAERGSVRETGVMSMDGGKTWVPAFDVLFLKHKDKP